MSPLSFLEHLQAAATPRHIPVALLRVEAYLRTTGYDPERVRAAIDHLSAHGTVRGCDAVDVEDRPAVDELVPERLRREHACYDGCLECRDETDYRRRLLSPAGRPLKSPDDGDLSQREGF